MLLWLDLLGVACSFASMLTLSALVAGSRREEPWRRAPFPPPPPPFSLDPLDLHQPEPSNPPMFLSFTRCGCVAISPTQGSVAERAAGVAQRLSGFQGVIIHRLPPLPLTESSPSSHLFKTPFWEPRMCFGIISRNLINPLTNPR